MSAPRTRWEGPLIGLFLAFQVAMPLSYYLGDGGYDERFSWRMFSTLRMARCGVEMTERVDGVERRIELGKALQIAWINLLKRDRRAVVEKFMRARCEGSGVTGVRYLRQCLDTDGTRLPPTQLSLDCAEGRVQETPGEAR